MKALVLCSGGIDSTTALAIAVQEYGHENVIALSMSYGQKHDKEIKAACDVARHFNVELLSLDLSKIFEYSNSSLLKQSTEEIPREDILIRGMSKWHFLFSAYRAHIMAQIICRVQQASVILTVHTE